MKRTVDISAMPLQCGSDDIVTEILNTYFININNENEEISYATSISQNVRCNPIRMELYDDSSHTYQRVQQDSEMINRLYHETVDPLNICSNKDLMALLENDRKERGNDENYIVRLLDMNIFNRLMKVHSFLIDMFLLPD